MTTNRITIDLGTTNTKVTLWQKNEPILKKFKTPKIIKGEYTDFDLKALWTEIAKTIEQFNAEALKQVKQISIASFGESGILYDLDTKKFTGECIAWFDERSQVIVDSISAKDKHKIYKITGLPVHSHYSACKIAWLLKYDQSFLPPRHKYLWLGVPDYLVYKFTGNFGTEYSLASRSLDLDLSTANWSDEVKHIMNIENVTFPKLYKAGEEIGKVKGTLKELLADNCIVSIAGHDHMVGSNSAKLKENQLLDSTGTTEAMMCLVNYPDLSENAENESLTNGIYTDGQHYTRFTAMPSAGSTIEWFMKMLNLNELELMTLMKKAEQDYKNHKLLNSNLLIFPHFNGSGAPYKSTQSKGLIYGVDRETSKEELVFGLFLGLTFEFAIAYESLFNEVALNKIKVIGPASKDPLWLQLKADLLRLNVDSIEIDQAVSAGAFLLTNGQHDLDTKIITYNPTKDTDQINYLRKEYNQYKQIYRFLKKNNI